MKKEFPAPLSILMPVCNEADIIESVIEEWVSEVVRFLPEGSEIFIDEAASTDGTRDILKRLCAKYPFLRVDYHERKDGFAAAARRLYAGAKCPYAFFTDSDGQYIPSEFWQLAPYASTHAIVHGAKIGRKDPFVRKVFSAVFNRVARLLFDEHWSDVNSAFRIVKREAIEALLPQIRCMPTLLNAEFLLRAEMGNWPIKQIRIKHRPREHGVSRGLPPWKFVFEAWKAFCGLLALKAELSR